jgi:uncharacterized protein involved in response to NO
MLMSNKPLLDYPLFTLGFRGFFLLAGLSALVFIAMSKVLLLEIAHGLPLHAYFSPALWHGHEMLFGYSTAVVAGFLLIWIKQYGGVRITARQAAALCLLWLYGRILPFYGGLLPDGLIAAVDLAFLPALAYCALRPLLVRGNYQSLPVLLPLVLLMLANAAIHGQHLGVSAQGETWGMQLALAVLVVSIVVVAGPGLPVLVERSLAGALCLRSPVLDGLAAIATLAVFVCRLSGICGAGLALAAVAALAVNGIRLAGWYDRRIWFVPILWVLYAGYVWLLAGFGLTALAAFDVVAPVVALHAFTIGGIGVLSMGLMARLALGQSGRMLKVSNGMVLAFVLVNIAALLLVFFPVLSPAWSAELIWASVYCWLAAFALFGFYYLPVVSASAMDGT